MALEPSQGMVEQAKKKNVYKEFIMEFVGKEPTSIKEGIQSRTRRFNLCLSEMFNCFVSKNVASSIAF